MVNIDSYIDVNKEMPSKDGMYHCYTPELKLMGCGMFNTIKRKEGEWWIKMYHKDFIKQNERGTYYSLVDGIVTHWKKE